MGSSRRPWIDFLFYRRNRDTYLQSLDWNMLLVMGLAVVIFLFCMATVKQYITSITSTSFGLTVYLGIWGISLAIFGVGTLISLKIREYTNYE